MGTLHTFRPRPSSPALSPADMRAQIEEAAQAALDQADALISILDRIDRDADREEGANGLPFVTSDSDRS